MLVQPCLLMMRVESAIFSRPAFSFHFFIFRLALARDRAEKSARSFLESFYSAIRKCVAFLAPKFPADIARHVLGVEFNAIQNETSRLHHVVSDAVPRHPCDFIFSHKERFYRRASSPQVRAIERCNPARNLPANHANHTKVKS